MGNNIPLIFGEPVSRFILQILMGLVLAFVVYCLLSKLFHWAITHPDADDDGI